MYESYPSSQDSLLFGPDGSKTSLNTVYQNPGEERACRMVKDLFQRAKRKRTEIDRHWTRYRTFALDTMQWPTRRPSFKPSPVHNIIFSCVQTILPILTDSRPSVTVMPQDPSDFHFSQMLTKVVEWLWGDLSLDLTMATVLMDALVFGTGLVKVGWDKEARDGLGEISITVPDPMEIYPDPDARDMESCNYIIHAVRVPLGELKCKFGEDKVRLVGSVPDLQQERPPSDELSFQTPLDQRGWQGNAKGPQDSDPHPLVLECWMRDDTTEEYNLDTDGSEAGIDVAPPDVPRMGTRLKYPKGRLIIVSNDVVLYDGHNPYEDGQFPFARLVDYLLPRNFWGQGEVQQLQNPQQNLNKMLSITMEWASLMSNGVWLIPSASGIDPDNLVTRSGLLVEYSGEQKPEQVRPPEMPQYIFQFMENCKRDMDVISGIHDVSRGIRPEGIEAGVAIETLQEAAQTRLRLKARNLEAMLSRMGKLMIARILQFYKEPRIVRIAGPDSGQLEYFSFQMTGPDGAVLQEVTPGQQGEPQAIPIKSFFDVTFGAGSSLPLAKARKIAVAEKLMGFFAQDPGAQNPFLLEYMKANDWPGAETIVLKAQQAFAQTQANAPAGEPPKVTVSFRGEMLDPNSQSTLLGTPVQPQLPPLNGSQQNALSFQGPTRLPVPA